MSNKIRTEKEIIKKWKGDINKPIVSINSLVYNHEKYVEETIKGFLIQETDFPFEVLIHDDASTDSSADIIRKYEKLYPHIIKPVYQTENQYSKHDGSITRNQLKMAKGKYYAWCEGDDYWIHPKKLQMQVDFLENNPDYGMVHTGGNAYIQKEEKYFFDLWKELFLSYADENYTTFQKILLGIYPIINCSTLYKTSCLLEVKKNIIENEKLRKLPMSDLVFFLGVSHMSKIKRLNDVTSVYRILSESASHSSDLKKKLIIFQRMFNTFYQYGLFYNEDFCVMKGIVEKQIPRIIKVLYQLDLSSQIVEYYKILSEYKVKCKSSTLMYKCRNYKVMKFFLKGVIKWIK